MIAWLAAQDWCTGAVGMYGTSYGGFTTIQRAMRRPPALKAIVPIYATDDRYTDDIHFTGGIRKAMEFGYPLFMVADERAAAGAGALRRGLARALAAAHRRARAVVRVDRGADRRPVLAAGLAAPRLRPDRGPTMLVAGWADLYRTAMLRMAEHLTAPTRLLMGPWSHMSPPTPSRARGSTWSPS